MNLRESVIVTCDVFIDKGGAKITARSFSSIEDIMKNITYDLKLYPKNRSELTKLINILSKKSNSEKASSLISIFYPTENGFLAKISLPQKLYLDSNDISQLDPFKF
jgi:DNA polymerase-3 subunit alpha